MTPGSRSSLVEQKRLQWAREREEMSRLSENWNPFQPSSSVYRTTIRTYPMNCGKLTAKYASTMSLRSSLTSELSGSNCASFGDLEQSRRRSPSLPPIYHRRAAQSQADEETEQTDQSECPNRRRNNQEREPEGETSGYASDSLEGPILPGDVHRHRFQQKQQNLSKVSSQNRSPLVGIVQVEAQRRSPSSEQPMGERVWQNPTEFNRPRWGSVWGQDTSGKDQPPPSWLERGLSRLDHGSQLALSPEDGSSSAGSCFGSEGHGRSTHLRGQNQPIDGAELQARGLRRQKALELQQAIKQQLEERERQRREERATRIQQELEEEERIRRDREQEIERFEQEQQRLREKEEAKQRKSQAMKERLEAAEREAVEEKRLQRRRRDCSRDNSVDELGKNCSSSINEDDRPDQVQPVSLDHRHNNGASASIPTAKGESEDRALQVPVGQDVAIVLSGRIDDPELFKGSSPLRLVNLMVTSPTESSSLGALLQGLGSPVLLQSGSSGRSRLLTPSKYRRLPGGRNCSTQTDCEPLDDDENDEDDPEDRRNRLAHGYGLDRSNAQADGLTIKSLQRVAKNKMNRSSIESRPRWNANRPGTRYRTQSEKDPHYQRRMRLRRRRLETSDEGSSDFRRSPSPSHRWCHDHPKAKQRITFAIRKCGGKKKVESSAGEGEGSLDSLNYLVPLHTDQNGHVTVKSHHNRLAIQSKSANKSRYSLPSLENHHHYNSVNNNARSNDGEVEEDIINHLASLRNSILLKKREWSLQNYPISPVTESYR